MPFVVIRGTFRLVSQNAQGAPIGLQPDGDSIQFRPDNPTLLDRLTRLQQPYRLNKIGAVQLRFEGLDALELHFAPGVGGSLHQPRPLADQARDFLTGQAGLNPVPYKPPRKITVDPPVPHDATPGYILSRSLEVHGRPVSFVFAGVPPEPDGDDVFLTVARLRQSINHKLVANGHAYPLFYDTLFFDLRNELAAVAVQARNAGLGIWPQDVSQTGISPMTFDDLKVMAVIFPKLFRRIAEFFADAGEGSLNGFLAWVAAKGEQVQDLDTTNFTHLDNIIDVQGNTVRLIQQPERLVFISEK
jgi:hypothetical protein